jgi:hypothetical protein
MNWSNWFLLDKPSFYSLLITGILTLWVLIIIFKNYKSLNKLRAEKSIHLIVCVGLLIGVHGLIHLGLEYVYNYNPIIN